MLGARILTALVLLPVVLGSLFWLPADAFGALLLLFAAAAAWEWSHLAAIEAASARAIFGAFVTALCGLALYLPVAGMAWLLGALLWWALAVSVLAEARLPLVRRIFAWPGTQATGAMIILPGTCAALWLLFDGGAEPWRVVAVFVVVWAADIGAYFAGRIFGRRALAPAISPRKTWEGAAGGALAAFACGVPVAALAFDWPPLLATPIVAAAILAAVVGDLIESAQKRHAAVKDSGSLLPGHGGVLDRVDSLLAAAPLVAAASLVTH